MSCTYGMLSEGEYGVHTLSEGGGGGGGCGSHFFAFSAFFSHFLGRSLSVMFNRKHSSGIV